MLVFAFPRGLCKGSANHLSLFTKEGVAFFDVSLTCNCSAVTKQRQSLTSLSAAGLTSPRPLSHSLPFA